MSWTDERIETLKRLWNDGRSATQCAAELGHGITRNAVIGKIHRLGLTQRAKASRAKAPIAEKTRAPRPRMAEPARQPTPRPHAPRVIGAVAPTLAPRARAMPDVRPQEEAMIPLSERVTLMELRDAMCRWPIGDPAAAGFRFCGAKSPGGGSPYCGYHAQVAYRPAPDRRRARDKERRGTGRESERRERVVDCVEAFGGGR